MPIKSDFPSVPIATKPFSDTFLQALWQHFSDSPHRPALINAENEKDRVTFGELYVYSHALAAFLHSLGFGYKDMACLMLPNCWQFVPIFLGAILQGGAITGANQQSTQYEIKRQLEDSGSKLVFCSDSNLTAVLEASKQNSNIMKIIVVKRSDSQQYEEDKYLHPLVISFSKALQTEPAVRRDKVKTEVDKDILILPYSSGTTGSPKGVMISHKNFGTMMALLTNQLKTCILPYLDKDFDFRKENQMLMLPFYHIYGFGLIVNCLLNGSTGIILEKFDHQVFCQSIEKYKFPMLKVVPPVLVWMAKSETLLNYDISSVKLLFSGAAPAGKDLCEKLCSKIPTLKFIAQAYGMTELSLGSNFPVLDKQRFESSGKLLANLEMKILDLVTGEEVDKGMPGELYFRGPTIMMGYFNRPEATAETIDQEGWMKTGDVGYLDKDNFLYIIDRRKELIKVKGFQVAPAELEDMLLSHPDIKDCAVIGIPDRFSGELPKAYVVKASDSLTEQQVLDFVKDKLAYYKHLRGGVEFVEEIPKSQSGKILRRFLRDKKCEDNRSKM